MKRPAKFRQLLRRLSDERTVLSESEAVRQFHALRAERDEFRRENGARLRAWRQRRGITLRRAAKFAGVSPGFLGDVEYGKRGLPDAVLKRLGQMR